MQTVTVYVGERAAGLEVTAREAKKHGISAGQTIEPGLAAIIARERLNDAGRVAIKILGRIAQRTSSKPDRNLSSGGYIRRP